MLRIVTYEIVGKSSGYYHVSAGNRLPNIIEEPTQEALLMVLSVEHL